MFNIDIIDLLMRIPGILLGLVLHEFAHALVSDKLGDPTPRSQGKITLDPRVHVDWIGFFMFMFFRFGWAKPVMTSPRYYKKPKRDDILVSIAGPFMNLLIAIVFLFLFKLLSLFGIFSYNSGLFSGPLKLLISHTVDINIMLFVLNMLPFPLFDGYHVVTNLFNTWKYRIFNLLEQYGMIIFILLAVSGVLSRIITPMINIVSSFLQKIIL